LPNPDGIDKSDIGRLVSIKSYFSIFELLHIHLFKLLDSNHTDHNIREKRELNSEKQYVRLESLIKFANSYLDRVLSDAPKNQLHWSDYYKNNTAIEYTKIKRQIFSEYLTAIGKVTCAVDIGANTGEYSEIILEHCPKVLSIESDIACCELLFNKIKMSVRPGREWQLVHSDILYPSPAIGWLNEERDPLIKRAQSELVSALAIIHHLFFSGSIDFGQIATFLKKLTTKFVIVEFIDKIDDKVLFLSKINSTRLTQYSIEEFKHAMFSHFIQMKEEKLTTSRTLFLYRLRE
jgi:hypothetical protein